MKITGKMVSHWYGSQISLHKEVIKDIVDLANGNYDVKTLKSDISSTWGINEKRRKTA